MRTTQKLFALAAVGMLVLTAFGPAVAAAVTGLDSATNYTIDDDATNNSTVTNETVGLSVSASENADGSGVVTLTYNGSELSEVDVTVETADENATYDGTGTYTTDANGTASLPAPANNSTVSLEISATYNNSSDSTTLTLGDGPAEADEEFEYDDEKTHGQNVAGYVHYLQAEDRMSGLLVAKFVHENKGNHPGFPEVAEGNGPKWASDDGELEAENETDGNETDVETEDDGKHKGKPDHAGENAKKADKQKGNPHADDDDDDEEDDGDDSENDE